MMANTAMSIRTLTLAGTLLVLVACGGSPAEPPAEPPATSAASGQAGIVPTIAYASRPDPHRSGDNVVTAVVTDSNGAPIEDAAVSVTYFMPAMPSMNMPEMRDSFELHHQGGGQYTGDIRLSMGGSWTVTVMAKRGEETVARKAFNIVARP